MNGRYDDLPRPGKVPQIVAECSKVILLLALSSLFLRGEVGRGGAFDFLLSALPFIGARLLQLC